MFRFRLQTLLLVTVIAALLTPRIHDWFRQRPVELIGYSNAELARQLENGRPVLVLFHADWNLESQKQVSANSDRIWSSARDKELSVMSADCTTRGSMGGKLMQQAGISTLPAFAIYSPGSSGNPIVVSELASESNLLSAFNQMDPNEDRSKE